MKTVILATVIGSMFITMVPVKAHSSPTEQVYAMKLKGAVPFVVEN
jgi:hypothetical protein